MKTMSYESFKEFVANEILNYLPKRYAESKVMVNRVTRSNGYTYDGLVVKAPWTNISPTIDLGIIYEDYQNGTLENTMYMLSDMIRENFPGVLNIIPDIENYQEIKNRLYMKLTPYKGREEYYDSMPHRFIEDMVLSYHIMMDNSDSGYYSAPITNSIFSVYGIDEEQLYQDALKSAPIVKPVNISSMKDAFGPTALDMSIISTAENLDGAAAILYPGVLDMVSRGKKIYLLPSSIHEFLVYHDTENADLEKLKSIVKEANHTVVEPRDVLSDNVYVYENGKLSIA